MDIEIKNEDYVISLCNQILSCSRQNSSDIQTLENTVRRINTNWESNGNDKESYVEEIERQIENLYTLDKGIRNLATSIMRYAENIKQTSAQTVESQG